MGGHQTIPALGNSTYQDVFSVRLARVSGLAVQKRDKRNVEPIAVFREFVLQQVSMNNRRHLGLCGRH